VTEEEIQRFWNTHPCGDAQIGGLDDAFRRDYEAFFRRYDDFRYSREKHIPACLDAAGFAGKRVLEIGLGQGSDSEQIIRRGAIWSGLDITRASVERVKARLSLRELPYETLCQGSALDLPFADHSFDLVFSHGVLHHIPDIHRAQSEIARVLTPGGQLIAMLYARLSMNYLLSICCVRRLGLAALYALPVTASGIYGEHQRLARETGLMRYLRMSNFVHRSTDGPLNPYSKVYDLRRVRADFPAFRIERAYKRLMHAPPLPVGWLPLQRWLGWHLWLHLRPIDSRRS
jgi:SAM-dependent methyltransferase